MSFFVEIEHAFDNWFHRLVLGTRGQCWARANIPYPSEQDAMLAVGMMNDTAHRVADEVRAERASRDVGGPHLVPTDRWRIVRIRRTPWTTTGEYREIILTGTVKGLAIKETSS